MKAFTTSLKFMGASIVFLALAACGKSDSGSSNVAAVQYGYVNDQCYDITHNTPSTYANCSGVGNTAQYQCVQTGTSTVVDSSYCQQQSLYGNQYSYGIQNGYGQNQYGTYPGTVYPGSNYGGAYASFGYNTGYSGSAPCVGMYYVTNGYTAETFPCNGYNCSGQFLYSTRTRSRVYCQ